MTCACGKKTENPKYCSKECWAVYGSKNNGRKPIPKNCRRCGEIYCLPTEVYNSKRHWCPDCTKLYGYGRPVNTTIGEYRGYLSIRGHHKSHLHTHIRQDARKRHKDELPKGCELCGYTKHVEVCHIKSVASFPDEALVTEVNARSNVRLLCPNHHWEFDNSSLDT